VCVSAWVCVCAAVFFVNDGLEDRNTGEERGRNGVRVGVEVHSLFCSPLFHMYMSVLQMYWFHVCMCSSLSQSTPRKGWR